MHDVPPWVIPVVIGGGLLLLAIVVLLLWLNSRGRFMFTDCIVRNRGAIAEPWHEFRTEGNRYFVIQLVIAFCSMFLFGGLALIFVFGWYWNNPLFPLPLLILLGVVLFLVAVVIGLIMKFMVPVMYRQRCDAMDAFRAVWQLIAANPGTFIPFRPLLSLTLRRGSNDRLPRRLRHLLHRGFAVHRHCHPPPSGDVSLCLPPLFHPTIWRPLRCLGGR